MGKPTLKVALSNRFATFLAPGSVQEQLKQHFKYDVEGAEFSAAYRDGSWDGTRCLHQRGRVPSGLFLEMQSKLEEEYELEIADLRTALKFREVDDSVLRPYQLDAVNAMIRSSKTGALILAATGVGKTLIAAMFLKRLIGVGVFIVDDLALLEQSCEAIKKVLGENVGIVGKSEFKPERITVATIQTLAKHRSKSPFKKWFFKVNVLIIDEVHVALNKRNLNVVQCIKPQAVYGLTATLQIHKPHIWMNAIALTGPVAFEYSIKEGVEEGYLSKGVIYRLQFDDPLTGIAPAYQSGISPVGEPMWIRAGSPEADYRYRVALNKSRNNCIEALVREGLRLGRHTVVLVERKSHLRVLSARFKDVKHVALSGDVASEDRFKAMKQMDAGTLPLILASRVFSKGVDVSSINLLINATGIPGRDGVLQRYGRGVRLESAKTELWFIDIGDRGNRFEYAAKARAAALAETGAAVLAGTWNGDAGKIFSRLQRGR